MTKETILIVDDDDDDENIVELARLYLEKEGYRWEPNSPFAYQLDRNVIHLFRYIFI